MSDGMGTVIPHPARANRPTPLEVPVGTIQRREQLSPGLIMSFRQATRFVFAALGALLIALLVIRWVLR